jgi:hypothetical protein
MIIENYNLYFKIFSNFKISQVLYIIFKLIEKGEKDQKINYLN